jgi:hypothetical protein
MRAAPFRFARALAIAGALALLAIGLPTRPLAQARGGSACNVETTERVVAIGDVHGAYDRFVEMLRATSLIDERERWSGGRAILVQTGDVLDRGPDSRKVLDLLRRLERDAERAGGRVYALIGNHEQMRMIGDWRYVSAGEYAAFRNTGSDELRDRILGVASDNAERAARASRRSFDPAEFRARFFKEVPLGFIEMRQAFSADGEYGRWLRTHVAVVKINGVLFVHGGISPAIATMGCEAINAAVAKDLTVVDPSPAEGNALFSSQETGPLWYRGLVTEPEGAFQARLQEILGALDAQAIVVGHSVSETFRIATRFQGRVVQIDTGMLGGESYKGGRPSALDMTGRTLTAVYLDGREPVSAPALASAPAPAAP